MNLPVITCMGHHHRLREYVVDRKEGRRSWWALPFEEMDLDMDGLRQYMASLEILKSNVASRLKEMEERASLARDFTGLLDAH
ncbi:hypothetical protein OIU79_008396 [Salix purpurea]|uniref:Uncharacterized protein n=1 Tax=Salix purpurea TaxID=77065 RepID=A0A9Q0TIA2_SALPP|nr:hypothetical protein OIU79_008396 [Salix purpurea]